MWTRVVIVIEVVLEYFPEVAFADDNHSIKTLPADGPDEPFDVRILPRRTRRDGFLLDSKGRDTLGEFRSVVAIAVAQQVVWRSLKRECVDDLLPGPSR